MADNVYNDETVLNGCNVPDDLSYQSAVRALHEMVNGELKRFYVLTTLFRHKRRRKTLCFHAVANITQTLIVLDETLFALPE